MAFVGEYQHRRKAVSPTSTDTDMKAIKPPPMKKTYEYRAYPTTKQRKTFSLWLALLRTLYNQALAWRKDVYQSTGEAVVTNTPETLERERSAEPCKTRGGGNYNKPRPLGRGN